MITNLIDRIIECDPGKTIVCLKCISRSDIIFTLPLRKKIMPGTLLVEMIAVAASDCIAIAHPEYSIMLGKIKGAKFIRPVLPGDQCKIRAEISSLTTEFAQARGSIEVNNEKVAEAEILFSLALENSSDKLADPNISDWHRQMEIRNE